MRILTIALMIMLTVLVGIRSASAFFVNYDDIRNIVYIGGYEMLSAVTFDKINSVDSEIFRVDLNKQDADILITSEHSLSMAKLSPNNSYFSVVENISASKSNGKGFFNRLLVFNLKGEIVFSIGEEASDKAIEAYAWDSSERFIAFITGKHRGEGDRSGSLYNFRSTGAYLYDVKNKTTKKLSDYIYEIKWGEFDNNLYLLRGDEKVFKYISSTNTVALTNEKALHISPDGKYSAKVLWYGESDPFFEVFKRQGNKRIVLFNSDRDKQLMVIDLFWSNDSKHLLIGPYNGSFVYDVPEKRVVRKIDHYVLGWNRGLTKIVSFDKKNGILIIEDLVSGKRLYQYKFKKGPWKRP
jgi:hypothetical protein